ncbi:MAG: hypothetical protein PF481_00685 [Bacteroidales bacterium]|jgi:hypothetical protein|nr:hypothetical protein [Bacteroidales bacterium]
MKNSLFILLSYFILNNISAQTFIPVPDQNLRNEITNKTNSAATIVNTEIGFYYTIFTRVTELKIGASILDITGISNCINTQTLILNELPSGILNPLNIAVTGLTNIDSLEYTSCDFSTITDLSYANNLTNLKYIGYISCKLNSIQNPV